MGVVVQLWPHQYFNKKGCVHYFYYSLPDLGPISNLGGQNRPVEMTFAGIK